MLIETIQNIITLIIYTVIYLREEQATNSTFTVLRPRIQKETKGKFKGRWTHRFHYIRSVELVDLPGACSS